MEGVHLLFRKCINLCAVVWNLGELIWSSNTKSATPTQHTQKHNTGSVGTNLLIFLQPMAVVEYDDEKRGFFYLFPYLFYLPIQLTCMVMVFKLMWFSLIAESGLSTVS